MGIRENKTLGDFYMGSQFAVNALKTAGSLAFTAGVGIVAVQGLSKVAVVASRLHRTKSRDYCVLTLA